MEHRINDGRSNTKHSDLTHALDAERIEPVRRADKDHVDVADVGVCCDQIVRNVALAMRPLGSYSVSSNSAMPMPMTTPRSPDATPSIVVIWRPSH